jgi:hypothetical protein
VTNMETSHSCTRTFDSCIPIGSDVYANCTKDVSKIAGLMQSAHFCCHTVTRIVIQIQNIMTRKRVTGKIILI